MGYGDQIIATGLVRGARERGKRIAFGEGDTILWDHHSELIFRHNPNIAPPGSERDGDLEWMPFYRGHRGYNVSNVTARRWDWNYKWRCEPGEFYFTEQEQDAGRRYGKGFVIIEPNVETWKQSAKNKDWGPLRYQEVARRLFEDGYRVAQFRRVNSPMIDGVEAFATRDFRDAAAILTHAALYIGPEGGLHHAAAAVRTKAVVIFGAWIPPVVTGYDTHINITSGELPACGSHHTCGHCLAAMKVLQVNTVYKAARKALEEKCPN